MALSRHRRALQASPEDLLAQNSFLLGGISCGALPDNS